MTEAATAYLRGDFSFALKNTALATVGAFGYDPDLPALPDTRFLSLRAGARFSTLDVSVFVDNVANSHGLLARNHDGLGGSLFYLQSFRPRTIGLTAQYRY